MGWMSFKLNKPVKQWFIENWSENYEVLDCALVNRSVMYGAILNRKTGDVFCSVYLTRWDNRGNFSYKPMTEHVGPVSVDCPERIFKMLTPINESDSGYSKEWRERVEKYHNTKNKIKGDVLIKTNAPIKFSNGKEYQIFKKIGKEFFAGELVENTNKLINLIKISGSIKNYLINDSFEIIQ